MQETVIYVLQVDNPQNREYSQNCKNCNYYTHDINSYLPREREQSQINIQRHPEARNLVWLYSIRITRYTCEDCYSSMGRRAARVRNDCMVPLQGLEPCFSG